MHQLTYFVDAQHDYFAAAAKLTGNLARELHRFDRGGPRRPFGRLERDTDGSTRDKNNKRDRRAR